MSKNDGGPAFPIPGLKDDADFNGMTLRDYFAAKALQGMCADPATAGTAGKDIVAECYDLADAMLEARKT
ncbi:hypothetical protein P3W53_03380 [Pseudomonas denitrificans (nom. rej.)]|nr:hypothetical protein [Pseudomonas denitrificans (nom. rej.)]